MALAIPVEIVNPEIVGWYECENQERASDFVSAAILAAFGLVQIIAYANLYQDAVDFREKINEAILDCLSAEHCFWMQEIFPFMKETFDYICALDNVTPEWEDPLDERYEASLAPLQAWIGRDECHGCEATCDNIMQLADQMGRVGAAQSLARSEERRSERRRELKAQGMTIVHAASMNIAAPGRRAMEASLSIANGLVALASSGINSGLSTFGSGIAGLANAR